MEGKDIKRGSVWLADLGSREGSAQLGVRPIIIIGNSNSNEFSPVVTAIPLTTANRKFVKKLPTHVEINTTNSGIKKDSIALGEQIISLDKRYILNDEPLFTLSEDLMYQVDLAVLTQLGLVKNKMMATV